MSAGPRSPDGEASRGQVPPREERREAAVATAFPLATDAAVRILERGGDAVDAAVAAAWALAVCEPSASGIGGETTALVLRAGGEVRVVDGHSHAPRSASSATIRPDQQKRGHRATTIPSTPATLQHLHRKYGRLPWSDVVAPAIAIAEQGYAITSLQRKQTAWVARYLRQDPATSAVFLRGGELPRVGEVLRQPQLAETLRRIAELGADEFYRGSLAKEIAEDMRHHGGLVDEQDLATFAGPVEREPVSAAFRGVEVVTVPPPGGGVQLLVALKLLEQLLPLGGDCSTEEWYSAIALATYGAFEVRELFPMTPDAMTPAVRAYLLGDERAREIAEGLRTGERVYSGAAHDDPGDTTHLTVGDGEGNVVALTQSIQSVFGAKVANAKLGFLYNNRLRTCPRTLHPSQLGPLCRPRSDDAPVLVFDRAGKERRVLLAMGSAGSGRITSSLLQVTSNVVDRGLTLAQAIDAPRVHAPLGGHAWAEKRIAPAVTDWLRQRFSQVVMKSAYSFALGAVHGLQLLPGATVAAADPRRDGTAVVLRAGDDEP